MADFSKQYCELYDAEFPYDFDIWEEFDKCEPDHYVPYICEGFGFIAIGNFDGNCMLAMPVDNAPFGTVIWKAYEDVVK